MDGRTWVDTLPAELAAQRNLLIRLLDAIEGDPRWLWLELGCSVADGRGDALSDLGVGVADECFPDALDDLARLLAGLREPIGILRHRLPNVGDLPHQRIFVQYASGVQIDLVAVPAHLPKGTQPENVILYDPAALRRGRWDASVLQADADAVGQWIYLGWVALVDLVKYLRRGSLWEAVERLEQARTHIWQLWAVAYGVRYPAYGLTSVLDHAEVGVPPGIEETVASLDHSDLLRAALAAADLLQKIGMMATAVMGGNVPGEMERFVRRRLEELAGDGCA